MQSKGTSYKLLLKLLSDPRDHNDECWEWPAGKNKAGVGVGTYGRICVPSKSGGPGHRSLVHRAAYEAAVGPIPDRLCVLHRCDNPPCFRPSHLFLGTALTNALDKKEKGRCQKTSGEALSFSRLTDREIIEIRSLYPGMTQRRIGAMFGVSQAHISSIILRKWWKHI
jgi:hypothetical protein